MQNIAFCVVAIFAKTTLSFYTYDYEIVLY